MLEVDRRRGAELQGYAFEPVSGWLARCEAGVRHAVLTGGDPFAAVRAGQGICYVTDGDGVPEGATGEPGPVRPLLTLSDATTLGGIGNALVHFVRDVPEAVRHPVAVRLRAGRAYPELLATLCAAALRSVRDGEAHVAWAASIAIQDHQGNELLRYEPGNGVFPHHFVFTVPGPRQAAASFKQKVTEVCAQWDAVVQDEWIELRLGFALRELNGHARGKLEVEWAAGLARLRKVGFRNVVVRAGIDVVGELRGGEIGAVGGASSVIPSATRDPVVADGTTGARGLPRAARDDGVVRGAGTVVSGVAADGYITPASIEVPADGPYGIATMPPTALDTAAAFVPVPYVTTRIPVPPSWVMVSASTPFEIVTVPVQAGDADVAAALATVSGPRPASLRAIGLSMARAVAALGDAVSSVSFVLHTNVNGSYSRFLAADGSIRGHECAMPSQIIGPVVAALCRLAVQEPMRVRALQQAPLAITLHLYAPLITRRFRDWIDNVLRTLRDHGFTQVVVRDRSEHVVAASDLVGTAPPDWSGLLASVGAEAAAGLRIRGDTMDAAAVLARLEACAADAPRTLPLEIVFPTPYLPREILDALPALQRRFGASRGPRVAVVTPLEQWEFGEWGTLSQWSLHIRTLAAAQGLPVSRRDVEALVSSLRVFGAEAVWNEGHTESRIGPTGPVVACDPAVRNLLTLQRATEVMLWRQQLADAEMSASQLRPYVDCFAGMAEQGWLPHLFATADVATQGEAHERQMFAGVRESGRPPLHCLIRLGSGFELVVRRLPLFERVWQQARAEARNVARFDRRFAQAGRGQGALARDAELELMRAFCVTMALAAVPEPTDDLIAEARQAAAVVVTDLEFEDAHSDAARPLLSPQHPWGAAVAAIRATLTTARRAVFPFARADELDPIGFLEAAPIRTGIAVAATPFVEASQWGRSARVTLTGTAAEQLTALRAHLMTRAVTPEVRLDVAVPKVETADVVLVLGDPVWQGTAVVWCGVEALQIAVHRVPVVAGGFVLDLNMNVESCGDQLQQLLMAATRDTDGSVRALPICLTLRRSPPLVNRAVQRFVEDALWCLQRAGFQSVVVRDELGDVIAATDVLPASVAARMEAPLLVPAADADVVEAVDEAAWESFFVAMNPLRDLSPNIRSPLHLGRGQGEGEGIERILVVADRPAVRVQLDRDFGIPRSVVIDATAVPDDWLVTWLLQLTDGSVADAAWLRECPIEIHWRDRPLPDGLRPLLPALDAAGILESLYGVRLVTAYTEYLFGTLVAIQRAFDVYLDVVQRQCGFVSSRGEQELYRSVWPQLLLGRDVPISLSPTHTAQSARAAQAQRRAQIAQHHQRYVARGYAIRPRALWSEIPAQTMLTNRVLHTQTIAAQAGVAAARLDTARWLSSLFRVDLLYQSGPTLLPLWRAPGDAAWFRKLAAALSAPQPMDAHPPLNLLLQTAHWLQYRFRPVLLHRVWQAVVAGRADRAAYVRQFALRAQDFAEWPAFSGAAELEAAKLCVTCQAFELEGVHAPDPLLVARVFGAVSEIVDAVTDAEWEAGRVLPVSNWSPARPEGRALAAARAAVRGEPPPIVAAPVAAFDLSGTLLWSDLGADEPLVRRLLRADTEE